MRVEEATSPPLPTFNCGLWRAQQAGQLPTLGILYIGPSCGSGLRQPEYAAGRARAPGPPCRRRRASGAAGGGDTYDDDAAHSAAVRRPAGCASFALRQKGWLPASTMHAAAGRGCGRGGCTVVRKKRVINLKSSVACRYLLSWDQQPVKFTTWWCRVSSRHPSALIL